MKETFRKERGKFIPYTIDDTVRSRIKSFSEMLVNMKEDYGPDSKQTRAIDVILNELDSYDRNIILAYYEYGESPSVLGRLLGVSPVVVLSRVKTIKNTIREKL